jgi:hypothetical protein
MRWSVPAGLAFVLVTLPSSGRAEIKLYDGTIAGAPEAQAWLTYQALPPGTFYTTGSGKTNLDTTSNTNIKAGWHNYNPTLTAFKSPSFPVLDRTAGFVIGLDVRVISESHSSDDRAGFSLIALASDNQGIEIGFWQDKVWAQEVGFIHAEEASFDTTASIRHYELAVAGASYSLTVDGSPLLDGPLRDYSAAGAPYDRPSFLFLGDDTTSALAESEFSLVTVSIPSGLTLAIGDASVGEGDSGTAPLSFDVTLSASSASTVTVAYATPGGFVSVDNGDYVPASGTLTFTPGDTTETAIILVNGDTLSEADEALLVQLSAAVGATIDDGVGQGTIFDDDPLPSLSIGNASVREGSAGTHPAAIRVTLSTRSGQAVTVGYTLGGGSATAGSDYDATPGTITFTPGLLKRDIRVPIIGDGATEANEDFLVTLGSPVGATIGSGTGRMIIKDDDTASPRSRRPSTRRAP